MHGCAIALPKRSTQRCGVRQFGPKPSGLYVKCSTDRQLAWILMNAGPEGVIEFALARCELTRCVEEERHWLRFCKAAVRVQEALQKAEEERQPKPLSWTERRALLVERDQQRRDKSALERSWTKASTAQQLVRAR